MRGLVRVRQATTLFILLRGIQVGKRYSLGNLLNKFGSRSFVKEVVLGDAYVDPCYQTFASLTLSPVGVKYGKDVLLLKYDILLPSGFENHVANSRPMKNLRPIRENCFGWWLADLEDEHRPWSPRIRPLGQSIEQTDTNTIDELRNKQLISRTTVPSREELFQLIQSGRLRHLERHQNIIETVLGPKLEEKPDREEDVTSTTEMPPSPVEVDNDLEMVQAIEDAVRNGYVDEDFARQISRLRELSANLTKLRSTSRSLHRDLQALDTTATRILSSVRSLRRDAEDLCFLEKMLAAAEGVLLVTPTCNLIV